MGETTVIHLICDSDADTKWNSWSPGQNHLGLNLLKTLEMKVDLRRNLLPPHHPQQNSVYCGYLQVSGIHNFSVAEVELPHRHCSDKGSAKVVPAGDLLHCRHPVGPLHPHHCLVWISHQTGQEQAAMDNQDCIEDLHQGASLQTLHTPDTNFSNSSPLVDVTKSTVTDTDTSHKLSVY